MCEFYNNNELRGLTNLKCKFEGKGDSTVQHLQKIFASCHFCTVRIISQSFQRDVEMRPKRAKLRMSQADNEPE
jgi:hypothetical protein